MNVDALKRSLTTWWLRISNLALQMLLQYSLVQQRREIPQIHKSVWKMQSQLHVKPGLRRSERSIWMLSSVFNSSISLSQVVSRRSLNPAELLRFRKRTYFLLRLCNRAPSYFQRWVATWMWSTREVSLICITLCRNKFLIRTEINNWKALIESEITDARFLSTY